MVGFLLLAPAIWFTWLTIDGLAARRNLRMELAEMSHVRYGLLNADRWREIIVPILNAKIDGLDLRAADRASLRPTVEKALYRLLDDVKQRMSAKDSSSGPAAGFLGQGNALIANMMVGALRPHVPEYADVVLAELGTPANKQAVKNYIGGVLAEGAKSTFGNVDMRWYSSILQEQGCKDSVSCQQQLGSRIRELDATIGRDYLVVLGVAAVAFALMMIAFDDQLLYFQSKSVLEVFRTLISSGRPEMWFVGVLVLMFSIVFPMLKVFTLGFCLHKPALLRRNRVVKFLAVDASKWSMADVMALAIFMSFVAFNGLIGNTMNGLKETGADLVIPTDSSKILPGYFLFIGFCLASLLLSKRLERAAKAWQEEEPSA
jgi:Paraquat-inducible protein A